MRRNELENPIQILTSTIFNNFAIWGLIKYLTSSNNIYVYAIAFIITTVSTLTACRNEIKYILKTTKERYL